MTNIHRVIVLSALASFAMMAPANGQTRQGPSASTRVRVINNRSPIVDATFVSPVNYVDAGAELIFVREQGNWIEVLLPGLNPRGETGFIARANLAPPFGTPRPPARPPTATPPIATDTAPPPTAVQQPPPPQQPRTETQPPEQTPAQRGPLEPRVSLLGTGIRGFGNIGAGSFLAHQSFDAILGSAPVPGNIRGPWFGGGVQFQSGHGAFFEGSVSFFRQTGERVFVNGDTIFQLGIPDTLTIMPISTTIGYRFRGRTIGPFIGGGFGQYWFSEKTPFDEPSEHAWQKANSFHALGGVEFRAARGVGIAAQAQYTRTPDALASGVAAAFEESDLGGMQFGVKVLIGR